MLCHIQHTMYHTQCSLYPTTWRLLKSSGCSHIHFFNETLETTTVLASRSQAQNLPTDVPIYVHW